MARQGGPPVTRKLQEQQPTNPADFISDFVFVLPPSKNGSSVSQQGAYGAPPYPILPSSIYISIHPSIRPSVCPSIHPYIELFLGRPNQRFFSHILQECPGTPKMYPKSAPGGPKSSLGGSKRPPKSIENR